MREHRQGIKTTATGCVHKIYYKPLRNCNTGYAAVTTWQILDHLFTAYGKISPSDLTNNDAKLQEPFEPGFPIKLFYDRIEDAKELAVAA